MKAVTVTTMPISIRIQNICSRFIFPKREATRNNPTHTTAKKRALTPNENKITCTDWLKVNSLELSKCAETTIVLTRKATRKLYKMNLKVKNDFFMILFFRMNDGGCKIP